MEIFSYLRHQAAGYSGLMPGSALTIAGSDPSGGAGIQADLKTFHQFGVYGQAAITLITVQNTQRVSRVEVLKPELIVQQIEAVLEDLPPQAAKTGALGALSVVEAVSEIAGGFRFPLVVDPVTISKHGARLATSDAENALKQRLFPKAALVTPNVHEAESLAGVKIESVHDMAKAAKCLLDFGCRAVLIKGGHLRGEPIDFLHDATGSELLRGTRVQTRHTHGTGCTYSAAITACLALGEPLRHAVYRAKNFIQAAIETAPALGRGYGPVNHFAAINSRRDNEAPVSTWEPSDLPYRSKP